MIGEKFLTERAICEQYEVSRATANKALSSLVSEGLLEFKKGIGTFVKSRPNRGKGTITRSDLEEQIRESGKIPRNQIRRFEKVKWDDLDQEAAGFLNGNTGEEVYIIENLLYAGETPIAMESRYIIAKYCLGLSEESLNEPLYSILKNEFQMSVTGIQETIRAVNLSHEVSSIFGVSHNQAGFQISSIGFVEDRIPLWWEKCLYKPGVLELSNFFNPEESHQQLTGRIIIGS